MKTLYNSIILLFTIYTLVETFLGLLSISIVASEVNIYGIIIGEFLLYIAIIYFIFFRLKKIPEFSIWFIMFISLLYFIPKNLFYIYTIEELKELAKISDIEKAGKIIFKFIFFTFSCFKYYKIQK